MTRIPTQKMSIEKINKIIEKGYYNTSTPDIAESAEVSIGIIYQYFNDKKDIFIEGIKQYSNSIMFPMINLLESQKIEINNFDKLLNTMIDKFIETHTISKKLTRNLLLCHIWIVIFLLSLKISSLKLLKKLLLYLKIIIFILKILEKKFILLLIWLITCVMRLFIISILKLIMILRRMRLLILLKIF